MSSTGSQTDIRALSRADMVAMLAERGVDDPEGLIAGIPEDGLDGVLGAIAFWDDQQERKTYRPTPGLLVKKIRDGGMSAYRRTHQRTSTETFGGVTGLSPERIQCMRGQLFGSGCFDRETACERFDDLARRLGTPVTALIDTVMGQAWVQTPPHPADPFAWRDPWKYPDGLGFQRYQLLVGGYARQRPPRDAGVIKRPEESQWDFACRFWSWTDPDGFATSIARAKAVLAERDRERRVQRAADEARMRELRAEVAASRATAAAPAAVKADLAGGVQGELLRETRNAISGSDSEAVYTPATPGDPPAIPPPDTSIPGDDDW